MRDDDKVDPLEAQLEAQQELASLHRHYRVLCNDKRIYTTEAQNIIRRQKAAIEMLLRDKKHLLTLRNVAGRVWNQVCDENNLNALNELLNKEELVQEETEKENNLMAKNENAERILEEKINAWRRSMKGSKDINKIKYVATQKQVRVMKNRLDNMSKKFSSAMTGNQKLREKIDDMISQKSRFQELSQRLENKLSEVKVDVGKVSETATAHFHARDEAQHRMVSLRERGERDLVIYNSEVKDFMRAIEHDRKLREFMTAKTKDRTSILRDETMKRELRKLGIHLDGLNMETKKYEIIFEKVKDATGIYDTDTLVSSFIQKEDINFALFNYVNAMNTEVESYQEEIQFLISEIEQTKQDGKVQDIGRKEILKELEAQLKTMKRQWSTLNKQAKNDRRILEVVKRKIEKLFNAAKCDRTAISELLGGGTSIDDYNALQYLGIIEQKCNEVLQFKAVYRLKTCGKIDPEEVEVLEGLQGAGPRPAQPVLSITPPNIEEESDLTIQASDTKPLTMDEVQALFTQQHGQSRTGGAATAPKSTKKKPSIKA